MLMDAARVESYANGKVIQRKGEPVMMFRLLREGEVIKSGDGMYHTGEHFGELEIFTRRPAEFQLCAAGSNGAVCLEWSVQDFMAYVSLNGFLQETAQQQAAMARTDPGPGGGAMNSRARRMAESAESSSATRQRVASESGARSEAAENKLVPHGKPMAGRMQQVALSVFREACRKVLVFARLDDEQLDHLHGMMSEHIVEAGTVVLIEGEKGAALALASRRAHAGGAWRTWVMCEAGCVAGARCLAPRAHSVVLPSMLPPV
jgi:hypothetical protein